MTGTSMSTPLISGVLACYASYMHDNNNKFNRKTVNKFIHTNNKKIGVDIKVLKIDLANLSNDILEQ